MTAITWEKLSPSRSRTVIPGLGEVIITGPAYNYTILINGRVAWTCWRENMRQTQLSMNLRITQFMYMQDFLPPEKPKPQIEVDFRTWKQVFTDWYDFADFLKQRQLKGLQTEFVGWEYIRVE